MILKPTFVDKEPDETTFTENSPYDNIQVNIAIWLNQILNGCGLITLSFPS